MNEVFDDLQLMNRLNTEDADNLLSFGNALMSELRNRRVNGVFVAVGGILTKEPPRKDIDTVLILDLDKTGHTEIEKARKGYQSLKDIVSAACGSAGFSVSARIEPLLDEEFDSDNILRHEGSITIKPRHGTPIEIINSMHRSIENFTRNTEAPFVILNRNYG